MTADGYNSLRKVQRCVYRFVVATLEPLFPIGHQFYERIGLPIATSACKPESYIENRCDGCHRCSCSSAGTWECETVTDGCKEGVEEDKEPIDEKLIDDALNTMVTELERPASSGKVHYVPRPLAPPETILVRKRNKMPGWDDLEESAKEEEPFVIEGSRRKRSAERKDADKKNENGTITFHHTIDDINEDTLKNTNASGTLPAGKIDAIPMASRRSSFFSNASTPLQIEYSPPLHSHHAADNKVDSSALHDDQLDLLVHHKIYETVGNQSQATRDKDLSKLVVNELKSGIAETIGDKDSPVISNITFTPENDTLTAMAFIAGNLLNKLWNIEKDNDDSLETEHMKHKKINNLLELFKEPLNLRQETFLKNALKHLSTAIETKNIANVSLCENIEELKKASGITDTPNASNPILKSDTYTTPETALPEISKKTAAAEALNKISNVLDLIKKYELAQNTLTDLKSNVNSTVRKFLHNDENDLSKDEKITLNVFGNILESLTKLIIPNQTGKKLMRGVKSKNLFSSDKDVKDRLSNLNLTNMSLTTKDKIILDYLTHIQNNPNCLLNKHQEKPLLPDIEGDILLNLSEFFKMKSMSDLLKLVDSENKKAESVVRLGTTDSDISSFDNVYTTKTATTTTTTEKHNKLSRFQSKKEKLKDHLKTILEDLIELQNISGTSMNGKNIEIAAALPCIYNLLNNKVLNNNIFNNNVQAKPKSKIIPPSKLAVEPVNKVIEIINDLKKELKRTTQTRRTNVENGKRPKSATVWERIVKNLGSKNKLKTRRNLNGDVPQSLDDIKQIISKIETSGSNTYKSIAYLAEVPAAERLLLLKTLALDTKRYILALNDISQSIETVVTIPLDQYKSVSEFLENVDINLNLNTKIINGLDKPKKDLYLSNRGVRPSKILNVYNTVKEVEKAPSRFNTIKLSRDQIINQLIKNRMMYYLKLKEETRDHKEGMNTSLAKKILSYLEIGNDNLARELFKVFVSEKKKDPNNSSNNSFPDSGKYETKQKNIESRNYKIPEPLIQFEEPKENKEPWLNQEQLMKQLINIKNMRL